MGHGGKTMKKICSVLVIVMICCFVYARNLNACGGGCWAWEIGAAHVPYGPDMDCPGGDECNCSGMVSREHGLTWHKTASQWYASSYSTTWSSANIGSNPGHVLVVNNWDPGGDDYGISNCGSPCTNSAKTAYEIEKYYLCYPRHTY